MAFQSPGFKLGRCLLPMSKTPIPLSVSPSPPKSFLPALVF